MFLNLFYSFFFFSKRSPKSQICHLQIIFYIMLFKYKKDFFYMHLHLKTMDFLQQHPIAQVKNLN
jgi:hypothetical protein